MHVTSAATRKSMAVSATIKQTADLRHSMYGNSRMAHQQEEEDGQREEERLERAVDAEGLQTTSTRKLRMPCQQYDDRAFGGNC